MNENLNNKEAVNKLIELVKGIHIGIFCTELTKTPIQSRPMSVEDVDDQGNLWFISSATSNKNFEILKDDQVQLFLLIIRVHNIFLSMVMQQYTGIRKK